MHILYATKQKSLPPDTFSGLIIAAQYMYVCGRGSAPDLAEGAYSARSPIRPISCIGGGEENGNGWEGNGMIGKGSRGVGKGRGEEGGEKGGEEGMGPHFWGQVYAAVSSWSASSPLICCIVDGARVQ